MTTTPGGRVPPRRKKLETTITRRQDITDDLLVMWIEKPEGYMFKAGQYCTIGSGGIERAYSIVSASHEEEIELFVELVPLPEGNLTPLIWELHPGDTVTIRPRAKGIFTFKPTLPNQFMTATVTGIVPFISIMRDYLHRGRSGHRFYVLQGASYVNELTYDAELRRLAERRPDLLTFVPTISRPAETRNAKWTGETGRVNTIARKYVDLFGLAPSDTIIYACGHPGMIEDVKAQFIPLGFTVEEERFWKQDDNNPS